VREHHVRGLPRHVRRDPDRDAHVGRLERRRVVHAVARHRDDLAAAPELGDDAQLVGGGDAREDGDALQRIATIRGRVEARDDRRAVDGAPLQPHLACDRGRRRALVAGEDEGADARAPRVTHRLRRSLAQRIAERGQRDEGEATLRHALRSALHRLPAEREDPEAVRRELLVPREDGVALGRAQGTIEISIAEREHLLGRPLDARKGRTARAVVEARHVVHVLSPLAEQAARIPLAQPGDAHADGLGHGGEGALRRRADEPHPAVRAVHVEVAVQHGDGQREAPRIGERVAPARQRRHRERAAAALEGLELHLVPGERPRLVRADHGDAAERLDGRHAAHERPLGPHPSHGAHERRGDDDGQALRDGGDGQSDSRPDHLPDGGAAHEARCAADPARGEAGVGHRLAEVGDAALERAGRSVRLVDERLHASDLGALAGRHHHGAPPARGHHRAGVEHGGARRERPRQVDRVHGLPQRLALAGQRSLVARQPVCVDHPRVGRDDVPGLQDEHVARDELRGRDRPQLAAEHARVAGVELVPRRDEVLVVRLDAVPDRGIEQDDGLDRGSVHELAESGGHRRRADQEDRRQVRELRREDPKPRAPRVAVHDVRPELASPARRLHLVEAVRTRAEPGEHAIGRLGVPGDVIGGEESLPSRMDLGASAVRRGEQERTHEARATSSGANVAATDALRRIWGLPD